MGLKNYIKHLKLDLTNATILHEGGDGYKKPGFEIEPKDYLRFAKEDLEAETTRGHINALSNSKRAIDCQIDEVYEIFNLEKNVEARNSFLSNFKYESNIPIKLKLIQALNMAPSFLISKIRKLRNKVEHDYKKPNSNEVKEAVEIADLFLRSVKGKIWIIESHFIITDKHNIIEDKSNPRRFREGILSRYDQDSKCFNISMRSASRNERTEIASDQEEFFGLLRITNSFDDEFEILRSFRILLNAIRHEIPSDKVKCSTF